MKYFSIDGTINRDVLLEFITFYNSYSEEDCTISLASTGGETEISFIIVHMINEMKNASLLIRTVYSSAFIIAYSAKCKKLLSPTAAGMHHFSTMPVTLNQKGDVCYWEQKCKVKNLPIDKDISENIAKKVMTKKEHKKYKKDRDVYFDFKRMKQIFPDAKVI